MDTTRKSIFAGSSSVARLGRKLAFALLLLAALACRLVDGVAQQGLPPDPAATNTAILTPGAPPDASQDATQPAATPPASPAPEDSTADAGGLLLVYTKAGELWRWQDGRAQALPLSGRAFAPRISLDGQTVAFLRPVDEFHVELWAVDLDGANERRLVGISDLDAIAAAQRDSSAVAINPYSYAWVPGGGQRLAFNTHQVYNGPGLLLLDDLHIVDAAGGQIQTLLQPGAGGEFAFSPDGSRVVISKPEQIFLANADGSEYRQVMNYAAVLTYSEYRFYAAPKWSPDGTFLRVVIPPADPLAEPDAPTALWRIPADGGDPVREGGVSGVPFFDAPVIYSPDLQRVAFIRAADTPDDQRRALYLATFDGRGEWQAASASMLRFGAWAADGRSFVYTAQDEMQAFIGSLDAAARSLGEPCRGAVEVRWVDATRLVCLVQAPGAFDLTLTDLNNRALPLDTITGDVPALDLYLAR